MILVFTLTAGRTGSLFLAQLFHDHFPKAACFHEYLSYESFGMDTPDLSTMLLFNSKGNCPRVQEFWQTKISRVLDRDNFMYAETSHVLMKAGLVENAIALCPDHTLHFIILERDIYNTLLSYHRRYDFLGAGNPWVWYLDPAYPRNMLALPPENQKNVLHQRLWYVLEVRIRAAYYRLKYSHLPQVHFHQFSVEDLNSKQTVQELFQAIVPQQDKIDITIPDNRNACTNETPIPDEVATATRQLVDSIDLNIIPHIAKQIVQSPVNGW